MVPRDRGTIVQVGSALGERSIPLQSAYRGAKHAMNGFTSSVRTELLHNRSHVRITVVQMPAVNTPQFSWVRTRLHSHPQPVPPIYLPEVAVRAVLFAADHPRCKQYHLGASRVATIWANRLVPAVLDRYLARTGYEPQQREELAPESTGGNPWRPLDQKPGADHGGHGIFDEEARSRSLQAATAHHPVLTTVTGLGALAAAALAVRRYRKSPRAGARFPPRAPW
ncbi:SDR family NAD(P)-dependent oxidoreductase [Streptomyces sp. HUAS TT7]|uniref:SDR family NAD(P)-dependent oxidoreductase n=1 Tax=Streptomyces sp. HUAS TT7 TaxID=3447507 RepID=UPI003F65B3A1